MEIHVRQRCQLFLLSDFSKIELKVGTILEAEDIEGSEKLIKLKVDLGEEEPRQILAGVKEWYSPKDFIGKQVVVVANLEPRILKGIESKGMLLAAGHDAGKCVLLTPDSEIDNGSKIS